jgi:hypothetical protein
MQDGESASLLQPEIELAATQRAVEKVAGHHSTELRVNGVTLEALMISVLLSLPKYEPVEG